MMKHILLFLSGFFLVPATCAQATYSVRFDSEWSASTHPSSFPSGPHMSPLIGGTHNDSYSMWAPGETARNGIEVMAETGGTLNLESEVVSRIGFGTAWSVISGGGIGVSPGAVETTFEIVASHPLVSLVSMIAPSPDWFVGVRDLPLLVDGEWVDTITTDLYAWDAGTDSGIAYTSANDDTDPAEPITALTDGVFEVDGSVPRLGTFTFTCQSGCNSTSVGTARSPDIPVAISLGSPWPNPATDRITLPVEIGVDMRVRVELVDALGRVSTQRDHVLPSSGRHDIRFDTQGLGAGLWLARIIGPDGVQSRSFLIVR